MVGLVPRAKVNRKKKPRQDLLSFVTAQEIKAPRDGEFTEDVGR